MFPASNVATWPLQIKTVSGSPISILPGYLIAEEDDDLKKAIEGKPSGIKNYFYKYIYLPKTDDRFTFAFTSMIALQLLVLQMSITKRKHLNKSRIENHGVHPDVPKNVSKSITVD
jgi:hypothetical protein